MQSDYEYSQLYYELREIVFRAVGHQVILTRTPEVYGVKWHDMSDDFLNMPWGELLRFAGADERFSAIGEGMPNGMKGRYIAPKPLEGQEQCSEVLLKIWRRTSDIMFERREEQARNNPNAIIKTMRDATESEYRMAARELIEEFAIREVLEYALQGVPVEDLLA